METASWVIKDRDTGAILFETFNRRVVDALNTSNLSTGGDAVSGATLEQALREVINLAKGTYLDPEAKRLAPHECKG